MNRRRPLIGDQEPNSSFIHRYNLRQAPRVIPTTKTQRKAKAQLQQQIQLDPDMITCHTNLTRDDIAEAQRNDKFCSELISFLHEKALPTDPVHANTILNLANSFLFVDDILYKIHYFNKNTGLQSRLKLVVPQSLTRKIILMNHVTPRSAHMGVSKTYLVLHER